MAHCCVQILKPSKLWLKFSDLCKSTLHLTKPTTNTWSTASLDPNLGSWSPPELSRASTRWNKLWKIPMCRLRFMAFKSSSWYTRHHYGPPHPPFYRTRDSGIHSTLHAPPRAFLVSGFSSTRRRTSHALATGRNLLLMSSDVITPRQQPRKHVHVNPSPR